MLTPATQLWGAATVIDSDPSTKIYRDVIFRPLRSHLFLDKDPDWGVYHADGALIDAAAYCRFPARTLVGQSRVIPPEPCGNAPPGVYVYGGPVIMHYGHFITAALPRLWQIMRGGLPADVKIVCHSHNSPNLWFEHGYIAAIFGALGLTPDSFAQFSEPVRIPRLTVSRPALQEQTYAHRVFRELCLTIGRKFTGSVLKNRTAYLSKSRLAAGGNRFVQEAIIDDVMISKGVDVLYPETMQFADQVRMFGAYSTLIGTVGSAFHTALFSDRASRIIGLNPDQFLNANHALVDGLTGNNATYFCAEARDEAAGGSDGFIWRLREPEVIAHALLELI